jgi:hypothetical protein
MLMSQMTLAAALLFAIGGWLKGRPRGWIFPSDAFFLLTLIVTGIVPFANLRASSGDMTAFSFRDEAITSALYALSIMYAVFGYVWSLRKPIVLRRLLPPAPAKNKMWSQVSPYALAGTAAFFVISLAALAYPPYLEFKANVVQFVLGRIDAESYQLARRVLYVNDSFIGGLIGRLRYSVYPLLFLSCMILAIRKFSFPVCLAISVVLTVLGPASLSKATLVVFTIYFITAFLLEREYAWPFRAINVIISLAIAIPFIIILLSAIYFMQYRADFTGISDLPRAIDLSFYRVFVATYQGLLQYFSTFPKSGGFAGVSAISMLAPIFGTPIRNLDTEVAIYFLGQDRGVLTSFPTIFIGNAYASFGYIGVAIYSFGVAAFLALVDSLLVRVRNRYFRIIYIATMTVNVAHFAVLAAPAALITYGCGIIPIIILICDHIVEGTARAKRARASLVANAQRSRLLGRTR